MAGAGGFGGGGGGVQGISPGIVLNFTRQETASPVPKTDSVDKVFTFYYARKILPATLNRNLRNVLHIQRPFYLYYSFLYFFFFWKIEFRDSI